jgi:hypothetical protein
MPCSSLLQPHIWGCCIVGGFVPLNTHKLSRFTFKLYGATPVSIYRYRYSLPKLLDTFNKSLCPKLDDLFLSYLVLDYFFGNLTI